jgi:hypothetical protein
MKEEGRLQLASRSLKRNWQRWTTMVRTHATGRAAGGSARAGAYQRLHQALLRDCRAEIDRAPESGRRFFEELEGLARPWLSWDSLAHADRAILLDVLAYCNQAERKLGRRPWSLARVLKVGQVAAPALGALAVGWAVYVGLPVLVQTVGAAYEAWPAAKLRPLVQPVSYAVAALIAILGYGVSRSPVR